MPRFAMFAKIRNVVLGDPEKVRAFREVDDALQADYARRLRAGGPWGEDETYQRLNDRVNDLWHTVPPWRR